MTVTALVISTLASIGTADATKVFAAQRPEARPRLLSNVVLVSAIGGVLGGLAAVAALIALADSRPDGVGSLELAAIAAGSVGALGLAGAAFLHGCSRFRVYSRLLAFGPWLYAVLLAVMWVGWGLNIDRAAVAWVAAQAVPALLFCGAAARLAGFGRPDLRLMAETVRYVRAGGLAHLLNARVDQVLLGLLATQAALGTYAVAVNASEVLFYLPSAVGTALLPAVARMGPTRVSTARCACSAW